MNKKIRKQIYKVDNRGNILATVMIVAVLFSVMVTILLYVTTKSAQMKQIDYQNKKNIYKAETVLDELKTIMVIDNAEACAYAYKMVMLEFATLNPDERKDTYQKEYVTYLSNLWDDRIASSTDQTLYAAIQEKIGLSEEGKQALKSAGSVRYIQDKGYFLIEQLIAQTSDTDGYTTLISTDICMIAPELDWTIDSSSTAPSGTTATNHKVDMSEQVVFTNWKKD